MIKRTLYFSSLVFVAVLAFAFTCQTNELPTDGPGKKALKNYTQYCASCHGEKVEAFVDRKWKHGNSKAELVSSISNGYVAAGMPKWSDQLSAKEIDALADLIRKSLQTVEQYNFKDVAKTDTYASEGITIKTEIVAEGLDSPWGMAILPNGEVLINDRSGKMYRVDKNKQKNEIKGIPEVVAEGQGGLLDVVLHPQYTENQWVYISYSKPKTPGKKDEATTAIARGKIVNDTFVEMQELFVAMPYEKTIYHYGSRIVFDKNNYLFFSVGERGKEKVNPQNTKNDLGKIHRLHDDGRIPADNPFADGDKGNASIWSYGHRNPQGLILNPLDGQIWETEHGPRGGDELNTIRKGANYGWPVISYGINYDGKTITDKSVMPGMEQPETYWIPSIAPCGLAYISSDKYPAWKGNILVGSLRFNYVNRVVLKNSKVEKQEKTMINIGRTRNVIQGADGFIYVGTENPGTVYRLLPQ